MAAITVTYSFSNGSTSDASQVNQNFTDIINGTSDGTKDFSISALTCAGAATFNGNVTIGNASSDDLTITGSLASAIPIKTNNTYDIGSATLGLRKLYLGNGGAGATCDVVAASHATTREYSIPDCGAAANFLMSQAAQTVAGQQTLSAALLAADGTVSLPGYSFSGDTNSGIYRVGADNIGLACNGTRQLSMSDGNLRLINCSGGYGNSTNPGITPGDDTNTGWWFSGADAMGFSTAGLAVWQADANSRVGLCGAPTSTGDVTIYNRSTNCLRLINSITSGAGGVQLFSDGDGTTCGNITIDATTNTTAYNVTSDERLKENLVDYDAFEIIRQLRPVAYNRKCDDQKRTEYGLLAQELYKVYPTAVTVGGDDPDLEPWSIDYSKLVGILLKTVQQLVARL